MAFLFKRRPARPRSDWDAISTVARAQARLRASAEILPGRRAGLVFMPPEEAGLGDHAFLGSLAAQLNRVLDEGEAATRTTHSVEDDEHGTRWVILEDGNFEDLTSSVFTVGNAISLNDGAGLLIAAVWGVHYDGAAAYWLYTYQRKAFYPFIPRPPDQRDHSGELALSKLMARHGMNVERSTEHWYPLWDIPF